jgi:glycosyltransferase involved in cell wall biosynthesis
MLGATTLLALPRVSSNKLIARLQRLLQVPSFVGQAKMLQPDLVHIHESGILGLLLSFCFKSSTPQVTVYFDYHDWIPFELSVFLRHNYHLYRLLLPFLNRICQVLVKPVDLVITVSNGQALYVNQQLHFPSTLVIPNVRPAIQNPGFDLGVFKPSIVFIGNVMRCRMLERIVHAISNPLLRSYSPKFHVFGVLSDPLYHKELENLADSLGVSDSLVFHGPYRSDADIQHQLSAGAVAHLFPLTFTPNPSNVESISSSNKFFSYATLGLPMLVHQSYTDMASTLATYHAGFSFFTLSEFVLRCDEV